MLDPVTGLARRDEARLTNAQQVSRQELEQAEADEKAAVRGALGAWSMRIEPGAPIGRPASKPSSGRR